MRRAWLAVNIEDIAFSPGGLPAVLDDDSGGRRGRFECEVERERDARFFEIAFLSLSASLASVVQLLRSSESEELLLWTSILCILDESLLMASVERRPEALLTVSSERGDGACLVSVFCEWSAVGEPRLFLVRKPVWKRSDFGFRSMDDSGGGAIGEE